MTAPGPFHSRGRGRLQFEWDPTKSASNKEKHGIDFAEATRIWLEDPAPYVTKARSTGPEVRFLTVGRLDGKMYTAIITMRDGVIRIISVRRSRPEEAADYDRF
jgi:uncharacterized DUF497 family protein